MDKKIYGTPELSFAAELRSVLEQRNVLTNKTKQKVLRALDNHIMNDGDTKSAVQRNNIVQEIYSSETKYVEQLEMLINMFKNPIEQQHLAPTNVTNVLFGNIIPIYNINNELLNQLKRSKENVVTAFLSTAPYFKLYSVYAYNYRNIINILENLPKSHPRAYEFIKRQECKPQVSNLNALLIIPIQRIPRYILLLKELKTYTPIHSEMYPQLDKAIKQISSIADHINGLVRDQENMSRMVLIQRCLFGGRPNIVTPGRKLIKEGPVSKIKNSKPSSSRYLILLSDIILYCNEWKGSPATLKCLKVLPLNKCSINAVVYKRDLFSLHCQSFSITLGCQTVQMANEWLDAIEKSTYQYIENLESLKRKGSTRQRTWLQDQNKLLSLASSTKFSQNLRKRHIEDQNNEPENCLSSPWKKLKTSCVLANPKQNSSEKTESDKQSYFQFAKQLLGDVTNSIQRYLTGSNSSSG